MDYFWRVTRWSVDSWSWCRNFGVTRQAFCLHQPTTNENHSKENGGALTFVCSCCKYSFCRQKLFSLNPISISAEPICSYPRVDAVPWGPKIVLAMFRLKFYWQQPSTTILICILCTSTQSNSWPLQNNFSLVCRLKIRHLANLASSLLLLPVKCRNISFPCLPLLCR